MFVGEHGYLARWNGAAIVVLSRDQRGLSWRDLLATAPDDVWLLGHNSSLRRFDGTTWITQASPEINMLQLAGTNGNDVWAVGSQVAHWDGNAWTNTDLGAFFLRGVHVAATNDVWVVADGGKTFHYDGTWTQKMSPVTEDLQAIYGDATEAWAGGVTNTLLHWQNGMWTAVTSPANGNVRGTPRSPLTHRSTGALCSGEANCGGMIPTTTC